MNNILVFSCFGLGDILMTTPVISLLYQEGYNVTLLCEEIGRDLIEEDWVEVITYNRLASEAGQREQIARKLESRIYDAIFLTVPSNNKEGSFVFPADKNNVFCHNPEEPLRDHNHTIDLNINLVKKFLNNKELAGSYRISAKPEFNIPKNRDVLFHLGAQNSFWRYKAFPLKLYREIMKWLKSEGFSIKIIGDDKQTVYAKMFADLAIDCTRIPLSETKRLMLDSYAFVGNDCGPAHLAGCFKLPNVVFFGPTRGDLTGPYPHTAIWNRRIQAVIECGPCVRTSRLLGCEKPLCHEKVSINDFIKEWRILNEYQAVRLTTTH